MQKENIIDITDSPIGNSGAEFIALAIPDCLGLTELRLSNCNIKDDGFKVLFEHLRSCQTVQTIDFSSNMMTEKSFDALSQLLQENKNIQRVELRGMNFKNKFALSRIKPYMDRILM